MNYSIITWQLYISPMFIQHNIWWVANTKSCLFIHLIIQKFVTCLIIAVYVWAIATGEEISVIYQIVSTPINVLFSADGMKKWRHLHLNWLVVLYTVPKREQYVLIFMNVFELTLERIRLCLKKTKE